LHPYLLEFGEFGLPTYGVLAAIGLLLGLSINVTLATRDGADRNKVWDLGIFAIVFAILGSKFFVFITDPAYRDHPSQVFSLGFLQAGGVYYGGLIGGVLGGFWFMHRNKLPMLRILDSFTPGIAFGHAIGRLGCLASGCCFGRYTEEPWGITFTNPIANQYSGTPLGIPLHPTQLYEFFANMAIFFVLMFVWSRKKWDGHVFGTYAFLYGIARFFIEFYRWDDQRGSLFGGLMSTTQFVAMLMVVLGGYLWTRRTSTPLPGISAQPATL
jgi:phosphatidylglycerol:prolipoprotein diacylglycerol transferase